MNILAESNIETVVYYSELESLIGPLTLCTTEIGLCLLEFGSFMNTQEDIEKWVKARFGSAELCADEERLAVAKVQLEDYFAGRLQRFELPLDMRGTAFQLQVWEALCTISYGEAASYKDIALLIGNPKAVRAVGGANNRNPVPIIVPCHRVIGASGSLIGYAGGLAIKSRLLQLEAEHATGNEAGAYLF